MEESFGQARLLLIVLALILKIIKEWKGKQKEDRKRVYINHSIIA